MECTQPLSILHLCTLLLGALSIATLFLDHDKIKSGDLVVKSNYLIVCMDILSLKNESSVCEHRVPMRLPDIYFQHVIR